MEIVSQYRTFGGWLTRYRHYSESCNCEMIFSIYLPPKAKSSSVPVLYWLSGLTCTDKNFTQKAGAQRVAAELGIAIVCPDTSPRGTHLLDEDNQIDIGSGAGFYLNATQSPWNKHYHMYDYIVDELPTLINKNFPISRGCSISGHSMGGHGAITIALKNPGVYSSVSAFAPICNPIATVKGKNRFRCYLGNNQTAWEQYDASCLITRATEKLPLLVDQGDKDKLLEDLKVEVLQLTCKKTGYPLNMRIRAGYDHSYYFVATFIEEHLRYHAAALYSS